MLKFNIVLKVFDLEIIYERFLIVKKRKRDFFECIVALKTQYVTRYTLQGRGAKHPLHPRPQGLPSSYLQTPGYVTGEPHTSHGVRFEFAIRLGRTPAKYECDVDDRIFLRFRKKSSNRLQKRVRNGSPSVRDSDTRF